MSVSNLGQERVSGNIPAPRKKSKAGSYPDFYSKLADGCLRLNPLNKSGQPISKEQLFRAVESAFKLDLKECTYPARFSKRVHQLPFSLLFSSKDCFYILTRHKIGSGSYKTVYDAIRLSISGKTVTVGMRAELRARGLAKGSKSAVDFSINAVSVAKIVNSKHIIGPLDVELLYENPRSKKRFSPFVCLTWRHSVIVQKMEHDLKKITKGFCEYKKPTLARIALGAARGLADLHASGYMHLDVKEANMLAKNGDGFLIDLDFAHLIKEPPTYPPGALFYRPPEVLNLSDEEAQAKALSPLGDTWAFGIVLYTLFHPSNAFPPFLRDVRDEEELIKRYHALPEEHKKEDLFRSWPAGSEKEEKLQDIIHRIFRKTPTNRINSAEVVKGLEEIVTP